MPIIQLDYVGLIVQNPSSSPEKTGSNMMTIPDISWLLCPFFISQDPATCIHATFAAGSLGRKSGTFHPELPATVAKSKIRFFFSCEISPFSSFWGTHAISKKDGMIWNVKPFLLKKTSISIYFYHFLSILIEQSLIAWIDLTNESLYTNQAIVSVVFFSHPPGQCFQHSTPQKNIDPYRGFLKYGYPMVPPNHPFP